ncbi:LuxR C-terminal-related transcriptional regulator [Sphingoaurantiacus capsulatus]|uniref:LuxR C-terminal-related transcriptional regulator n=1 Tax=Sphingoaurantiacus capsulatus TaxID=1771310 RepID=A0ABV7X5D4_9SPHN
MSPSRILICDDHPMVRHSLTATVTRLWPEAELLEAGDYPTAWALAARAPDLILADLGMPGAIALEGVREMLARAPDARCLVITGSDEDATAAQLAAVGVDGLVRKTATTAVIEAAMALVAGGGRYMPAHIMAVPVSRPAPVVRTEVTLTDRQREVLRLMAEGQTNKDIGRQLGIAPDTVKTHVSQIFGLLGALNRADACMKGKSLGVI